MKIKDVIANAPPAAERKRVRVVLERFEPEGRVEDVMQRLADLLVRFPDHDTFEIEEDHWGYEHSHYDVQAWRLENDEEFATRLVHEARQAELAKRERLTQRERDEKELARLAKKLRKKVVDKNEGRSRR